MEKMEIVKLDISSSNYKQDLKKLRSFFRKLPNNEVFKDVSIGEYNRLSKLGSVHKFLDGDTLVGGLFIYTELTHNTVLNYYIAPQYRETFESLKVLRILTKYIQKSNKKTFFKTTNPKDFDRFSKHVNDNVYELLLPNKDL